MLKSVKLLQTVLLRWYEVTAFAVAIVGESA